MGGDLGGEDDAHVAQIHVHCPERPPGALV
jgi:hypothetical protein